MTKLDSTNLPQHIAIIMDGNRRWAKQHGLPPIMGHKKVVEERLEPLIERASKLGIGYITFWAWSTENWHRDSKEVRAIMTLFKNSMEKFGQKLITKGARLRVIGDIDAFPDPIRQGITKLVHLSSSNSKITTTLALNYGGHDELARAIIKLVNNQTQKLTKEDIQELLPKCLDTAGIPDPDLIIRTSGEHRLSGFMPWQSVYSELYFPDVLMPDFTVDEFNKALTEYQNRQRRFGK